MAAIIDKHERAEALGAPRVLVAGGSNNAFSINSEMIQDSLGIPVLNLGLNVGLGLRFILNELEDVADEGDIVFIFMTYFESMDGIYALKKHTVDHFPKAKNYFRINLSEELSIHTTRSRENFRNMLASIVTGQGFHRSEPLPNDGGVYNRNGFNKYGDFNGHHDLYHDGELQQRFVIEYRYWEGIQELNRFYEIANSKNIHVFFVFPGYPISELERNREVIDRFADDLKQYLNFPIIGSPGAFTYDDSKFFDTVYHLNQEGAKKYTADFIRKVYRDEELMRILKNTQKKR